MRHDIGDWLANASDEVAELNSDIATDSESTARPHKYGAETQYVDDIRFDSKKEAARYVQLRQMEEAGEISSLRVKPRYLLQRPFEDSEGNKHRRIEYEADFAYVQDCVQCVEDVKGYETPVWRLKRKLFLYRYPTLKLVVT